MCTPPRTLPRAGAHRRAPAHTMAGIGRYGVLVAVVAHLGDGQPPAGKKLGHHTPAVAFAEARTLG